MYLLIYQKKTYLQVLQHNMSTSNFINSNVCTFSHFNKPKISMLHIPDNKLGLIKYHSLNSIFSWETLLAFDDLRGLTFCGNIYIGSSLS